MSIGQRPDEVERIESLRRRLAHAEGLVTELRKDLEQVRAMREVELTAWTAKHAELVETIEDGTKRIESCTATLKRTDEALRKLNDDRNAAERKCAEAMRDLTVERNRRENVEAALTRERGVISRLRSALRDIVTNANLSDIRRIARGELDG